MALNRITMMGRFTKDPELRRTNSGTAVTTFSLAVERDFKNKQTGERDVDFINCVAYKSTAEMISRFFQKGAMAIVDGRLQIRRYQTNEGDNRYITEVIVTNIYFGASKKDQESISENSVDQEWEELENSDKPLPF